MTWMDIVCRRQMLLCTYARWPMVDPVWTSVLSRKIELFFFFTLLVLTCLDALSPQIELALLLL